MKKGILGIVSTAALTAAGLQAQVGGGGGGGSVIVGRGAMGAPVLIEQFQQAGTMTTVAGRGLTTVNGNSSQTVIGRPVSGTEEQRSMQTLGDGTVISTSESTQFYRDSAGRTRKEMPGGTTVIFDPVAHVTVTLNPARKTARRISMPKAAEAPELGMLFTQDRVVQSSTNSYAFTVGVKAGGLAADMADEKVGRAARATPDNRQREDLGVESLNGILATHTRNTLTIPQGQIGNDRDIHVVNERWYSDDLQMLVKTVNSDPRFGENTYEFTNVSRDEPDASLFQIPADYSVSDLGSRLPTTPPAATTVNK